MSINAQPFSPTFKLVGNLTADQILVYDASENAFVNATNSGASGSVGLSSVSNTGTGTGIGQQTGSALELKSLIAGTNLTITDNGQALVIDATVPTTAYTGTNLGSGEGIYKQNNIAGDQLEFKSIAVGNGLSISEANDTLTIECTISTAGYLQVANNLSDIGNAVSARTNLDVYSKAESDAKYLRIDASSVPTVDNAYDLGSSTKRFNDVYAETFHGTAILADNLTISGSATGDVLTWNGSTWVSSAPTGGGGGGGAGVPQTLTLNGNTLSISGGNSVTLASYTDDDPFIRLDASSIPTVDNQFDIGSSTKRFQDIYAESFQGVATAADTLTVTGNSGDVLTYNGSQWVAAAPTGGGGGGGNQVAQTLALNGSQIAISSGNSIDIGPLIGATAPDWSNITNKPTIPADVSDLTDTTNLLVGSQSLVLIGTQLTISGGNTVDFAGMFTDTDNQTLTFDQNTNFLTIANGNAVDLSPLAGGGGASALSGLSDVDTTSAGHVPTDGQALLWSQTMGHWMPGNPASSTLTGLSDVDSVDTPTTGDMILYDGSEWKYILLEDEIVTRINTSKLQNIVDSAQGVNVTGRIATDSIDVGSGGGITVQPGGTVDLQGTTVHFGSATIAGGNAFNSVINNHLWSGATAPTNGYVLSWNSTLNAGSGDYEWVAQSGGAGSSSFLGLTDTPGAFTGNTFVKVNNAGTALEFTTVNLFDGDYNSLTNQPTIFDGDYNNLTNKPTIPADVGDLTDTGNLLGGSANQTLSLVGTQLSLTNGGSVDFAGMFTDTDNQTLTFNSANNNLLISNGNSVDLSALSTASQTIDDLQDVNVTGTQDGQFLVYNNTSGDWENMTVTLFDGDYNNLTNKPTLFNGDYNGLTNRPTVPADLSDLADVSSSAPSTGQVLKWDGSAWAPASDSTGAGGAGISLTDLSAGSGLSYNSTTGAFSLNAQLNDLLQVNAPSPSTGDVLKWSGSEWAPAVDNAAADTDALPEGSTNLYFNAGRFDAQFNTKTTDDLTQGTTNIYYDDNLVDARMASQIIPGANITITPGAGGTLQISAAGAGTSYTDADARQAVSVTTGTANGGGTLTYNNTSGIFTYQPADLSNINFSNITNTPTTLAGYGITDAFDGAYASLSGQPVIPTDINQLTDANSLLSSGGISEVVDDTTPQLGGDLDTNGNTIAYTFDISAGSGVYQFSDSGNNWFTSTENNPSLYLQRGQTYKFNVNASGHPFYIKTQTGTGTGNQYTKGVVNQGTQSGIVSFTVPMDAPNTLFYQCSQHAAMNGQINVTGAGGGFANWAEDSNGHILPASNATYDIGSADKKVRHLFLSDNSLYIGDDTLKTQNGALLLNGDNVQDYNNLANKPTIPADVGDLTDTGGLLGGGATVTGGTGIQVNTGVVSLNANVGDLNNVSSNAPGNGQVLKWDAGTSLWTPSNDTGGANLSTSSVGDLNDVDLSGVASGNFLSWDGTKFVAVAPSAADISNESITELSDVSTDTPNNGDVLTWDGSAYAPQAPSGGGGGGGISVERFKLNYATNGNLSSITNASSGVSATILSATGGTVEIEFSGYTYPPSNILIYGYARASNQYGIMPLNKDIATRTLAGGGSAGSPTAFGSLGSLATTLTLREADTGASRSFGTDTHAWVIFTMMS